MKEITCCFTGHRQLPANKIAHITKRLDGEINNLIHQGVTTFLSGGALGFDQIAASMVLAKKETRHCIRLIFALPCKNQDAFWNKKQRDQYQLLLGNADEIFYVSQEYDPLCMQRRNQYMVALSAHCICALLHKKSGTGQTVRFARSMGLQIINVAV